MNDADAIVVQIDKDLEDLIPEFFASRRADVESIRAASSVVITKPCESWGMA
ncbi:MAG TPA: hypothetical protein VGA27_06870 [Candidatus Binatia bacterium]